MAHRNVAPCSLRGQAREIITRTGFLENFEYAALAKGQLSIPLPAGRPGLSCGFIRLPGT